MPAGPERIYVVDELHKIPCVHDAAVRAEISRSVLYKAPREKYAWKFLSSDTYPRICLRILKENVIAWLELFDEVVLQQQGISLRLHDGVLRISDLGHHHRSLSSQALSRHEILRNSLMQVFCLTHINNIPLGVIISVDAWGMWK